jgi:hypothetical protein
LCRVSELGKTYSGRGGGRGIGGEKGRALALPSVSKRSEVGEREGKSGGAGAGEGKERVREREGGREKWGERHGEGEGGESGEGREAEMRLTSAAGRAETSP